MSNLPFDWAELDGFQLPSAAWYRAEYRERKEAEEFRRLCRLIRDRRNNAKWWRSLSPEERARVYEYRRRWAAEHPEQWREMMRRGKARYRAKAKNRETERCGRQRREAAERQERLQRTYMCVMCDRIWHPDPEKRIPCRAPQYCSDDCRRAARRARWAAGRRP